MKLRGFFPRARRESLKSSIRIKVGAVIANGGSVIAVGRNQKKSHPLVSTFTLHAEASAIISRRYNSSSLENATMWIYRETSNGIPAMARPCEDCLRLIIASGIRKVYYTASHPPYYHLMFIRRNKYEVQMCSG